MQTSALGSVAPKNTGRRIFPPIFPTNPQEFPNARLIRCIRSETSRFRWIIANKTGFFGFTTGDDDS